MLEASAAEAGPTEKLSSANPVYEKFYRQVDSANAGRVLASDAAVFLKKSGLTDLVLGKIWDLADTDGKGVLSKQTDTNSPLLLSGTGSTDVPWAVKLEDKAKYDAIFDSLNPVNGLLSGDKVKPVLLNSKLPVDILGRVWELSDIDRDGMLDRDEFAVAMFLVYCALEKEPVPMSLPAALVPPSKRKPISVPGAMPLIPSSTSTKESHQSLPPVGILAAKTPLTQWVVSPADKMKYDEIFVKTDKDMDGFVSGVEARELFLKTGLPSALLAHIWALCDTKDCGKLSKEQFALAFYLINQKLTKGIDPPQALTLEMIPPSDRGLSLQKSTQGPNPAADFSAIKELDTLNNEIVDLQREKNNVEQDLKEKEDTIKQRTSEVQDLQDEVKRESSHLQKLQAQKQEAQEILNDLDEQKAKLEEQLNDIRQKCAEEAHLIAMLKAEITSQESKISAYEDELSKAQEELSRLQQETAELEHCIESGKAQLGPLQQHLQDSQQEINSVQTKLLELKELENTQFSWHPEPPHMLVNGTADHSSLSNSSSETANLNENAERESIVEEEQANRVSPIRNSPETTVSVVEEEKETPAAAATKKEDPFDAESHPLPDLVSEASLEFFQSDPFVGSDPFKDDPFGKIDPFGGDPFKGSDPFAADCFFKQSSSDPFMTAGSDPFSTADNSNSTTTETLKKNDPFAPGGTTVTTSSDLATDPFASLFGNESFGSGFADFSTLSKANNEDPFSSSTSGSVSSVIITKNLFEEPPAKNEDVPPALPPKTGTPTRPCPPPPGKRPINQIDSSDSFKPSDPFQPFPTLDIPKEQEADLFCDPFAPTSISKETDPNNFANFSTYSTEEDMIEWAKRESEREEKERLARLKQQEQEDLELAIALSKSEISEA
ncbi:epidermal growth factor receptor substrate 15 isoform X5 [Apus apus]|uniref:epidermal growth factor receptor substrate 15 isoform X5 n=1 Tax=Apus apus TaxID=8895 RepID=UPI0021F882A0|nr:epidermal growth factor receptor substrate 15 isoform X5 [Apus apus]